MIRVTVWNEYVHEREYEGIAKVYPKGIHGCIADFSVWRMISLSPAPPLIWKIRE